LLRFIAQAAPETCWKPLYEAPAAPAGRRPQSGKNQKKLFRSRRPRRPRRAQNPLFLSDFERL
jgi:hypothetical protein